MTYCLYLCILPYTLTRITKFRVMHALLNLSFILTFRIRILPTHINKAIIQTKVCSFAFGMVAVQRLNMEIFNFNASKLSLSKKNQWPPHKFSIHAISHEMQYGCPKTRKSQQHSYLPDSPKSPESPPESPLKLPKSQQLYEFSGFNS